MLNNFDRLRRTVGERIRIARESKGWTQDNLAENMEIADRQTISAIESGERKVSAEEIMRFIGVLGHSLEFFTDPDLVVEEAFFSYRAQKNPADIEIFEGKARKLIEANRRLRSVFGEAPPPVINGLRGLSKASPIETAEMYGYRFFVNWNLGECPAKKLRESISKFYNILVLEVDAPRCVSGAACHLDDGDVILLNRHEPSYRKNFTLGHEFFHLLTWTEMPPARADIEAIEGKRPKVEQLADAFTASLLMPSTLLKRAWDKSRGCDQERVLEVARHFDVSGEAAYLRLLNCRYLRDPGGEIKKSGLSRNEERQPLSAPLEIGFVQRLHQAIADGRMTANRAGQLLDATREELLEVFREHRLTDPINS